MMQNSSEGEDKREYGDGNCSYLAAGGERGIAKLCEDFYGFMDTLDEAKQIRDMHEEDLNIVKDKLTVFLCGWMGGPKNYAAKYGPIHIPRAHQHLVINKPERDAWLLCMFKAIDQQPYKDDFKEYLKIQITVPADRILQTSKNK